MSSWSCTVFALETSLWYSSEREICGGTMWLNSASTHSSIEQLYYFELRPVCGNTHTVGTMRHTVGRDLILVSTFMYESRRRIHSGCDHEQWSVQAFRVAWQMLRKNQENFRMHFHQTSRSYTDRNSVWQSGNHLLEDCSDILMLCTCSGVLSADMDVKPTMSLK